MTSLPTDTKNKLHPRNRHRGRYDFKQLIKSCPELAFFVMKNKYGDESIDFSNPDAVKALNKALLQHFYNILWDIPKGYLCPPIPGRANYIHHIADFLATFNEENIPLGSSIYILDIGTGANCIYPIIGQREYGWRFIGSDIDSTSIDSATKIVQMNDLSNSIELRLQQDPTQIFKGILQSNEKVTLSICNPPFHASLQEALNGTKRKWKNLGIKKSSTLNFGGRGNELSCLGGEIGFLKRMIFESALIKEQCRFFSTLVSKEKNLPAIYKALKEVNAVEVKTIDMEQGQKKSRIVIWTFKSD